MKKTVLLLVALSMIFMSAQAKEKKNKKSIDLPVIDTVKVFTNSIDSMSYALGVNVGESLQKNLKTLPDGKYNIDLFIKAFNTSIKGDSTLMKPDFVKEFLNKYFQAAQQKDVVAKKAVGEKFLAENSTAEGVNVTPSGLQYKVLIPAEGKKPTAKDTVKVHYTGTLIDGTKFDRIPTGSGYQRMDRRCSIDECRF